MSFNFCLITYWGMYRKITVGENFNLVVKLFSKPKLICLLFSFPMTALQIYMALIKTSWLQMSCYTYLGLLISHPKDLLFLWEFPCSLFPFLSITAIMIIIVVFCIREQIGHGCETGTCFSLRNCSTFASFFLTNTLLKK